MAQFVKHFVQDLQQNLKIRQCGTIVFNADDLSNVVSVELYDGETPYTPTGTVVGAVICSDGSTVPITNGTISGNTVSITLTAACFAIQGQIGVGIQLVTGSVKTTILKAIYNAERFETDDVIDPESRITLSVSDLIDDINSAITDLETAIGQIPADYSDLMAAVAPAFSASSAYSAGAYVWYDGVLYQFSTAHAAGSWTGTDATAAVIANDVAELKSSINVIDNALNIHEEKVSTAYIVANNTQYANNKILTADAGQIGKNIDEVPQAGSSGFGIWIVDISGYDNVSLPVFKTTAAYGSLITDADGTVLQNIVNTTADSGTIVTVPLVQCAAKLYLTINPTNAALVGDTIYVTKFDTLTTDSLDARLDAVEAKIPDAPTTDGTYKLRCTVASGTPTYAWVSDT